MSSVPDLERPHRETFSSGDDPEDSFSIAPSLRRVRHIQSIIIYNIRLEDHYNHSYHSSIGAGSIDLTTKRTVESKLAGHMTPGGLASFSVTDLANELGLPAPNGGTPSPRQTLLPQSGLLPGGYDDQIAKQLKMQEVSRPTFFDSFYTLNRFMNTQNPFYISSVFKKRVSIQEDLDFDSVNEKSSTLNLFIRLNGVWQMLCQYHVKLSLLVNIGDNLEEIHEHLKDQANFLIIKLADDCYYALPDTNLSPYWILTSQEQHKQNVLNRISTLYHSRQRTCSYDQIMKLDNLSTCIRDLLVIKKDLEDRIHETLQSGMHTATEPQMKESSARNAHMKRMADAQRFRKFQLTRSIEHNKALQDAKQNTIRSLKSLPESMQERDQFGPIKDDLADHIVKLDQVNVGLNLEKSRIAKDLLFIFPIESTGIRKSSSKYNFQLFGYKFPSTSSMSQLVKLLNKLSRTQMARLNALIGYMVLILIKLSGYLRIPLRFPARFLGSNSYIHDPISHILTKNRLYPLFITQNSTLIIRFSYGLILLTKDLNQLFEYENLYKVDDFNLLVNFKIFLTCLTSYDGRSDNIRDLISESAVSDDVGTSFKPGSPSQIMRDSINETLKSEERTNHIRKHLLEQSDYK